MKLRLASLLVLAASLGANVSFAQAVVEGRIALPKSPAAPVANKRYTILAKGGVLSPFPPVAVIYLDGPFPKPATQPVRQMAQKDLTFVPTVLPVQIGTKVEFPNLDDTFHNIFSYSAPKRFDLGRYRSDERPVPSEVFEVAGLVTLHCDIHEHMRGLILVLETPYFVVSDTQGRYRLAGLPYGHYILKVWIDSRTTLEHTVDLDSGSAVHVDFP